VRGSTSRDEIIALNARRGGHSVNTSPSATGVVLTR